MHYLAVLTLFPDIIFFLNYVQSFTIKKESRLVIGWYYGNFRKKMILVCGLNYRILNLSCQEKATYEW